MEMGDLEVHASLPERKKTYPGQFFNLFSFRGRGDAGQGSDGRGSDLRLLGSDSSRRSHICRSPALGVRSLELLCAAGSFGSRVIHVCRGTLSRGRHDEEEGYGREGSKGRAKLWRLTKGEQAGDHAGDTDHSQITAMGGSLRSLATRTAKSTLVRPAVFAGGETRQNIEDVPALCPIWVMIRVERIQP